MCWIVHRRPGRPPALLSGLLSGERGSPARGRRAPDPGLGLASRRSRTITAPLVLGIPCFQDQAASWEAGRYDFAHG